MDMVLWLVAACGWSVATILFLIPACYWFVVHGLAIVGFFAIATGRTKTMWPPFESAVATLKRVLAAVQHSSFSPVSFNHINEANLDSKQPAAPP
jgi:hypothetical protein